MATVQHNPEGTDPASDELVDDAQLEAAAGGQALPASDVVYSDEWVPFDPSF